MRRAHEIVDAAAGGRVLVFGSLPPGGRDLDLLVRREHDQAIVAALEAEGFQRQGHELARFSGCSVEPVELIDAGSWGLPPAELEALYADAIPLNGCTRVVRPAPHHALLILARRVARSGVLDEKRRRRLEDILAEEPEAFSHARKRADAWAAEGALQALEARTAPPAMRPSLVDRARERRWRRGTVIALSGLDGAGKSSQAAALRETLERMGYEVETAWTRINWDDLIWRIGTPLKRAAAIPFRLLPSRGGKSEEVSEAEVHSDPVKQMRERSGLLTHAWLMVIAFANAWSQRRLTRDHLKRGAVVICDRYTLDSIVALRYEYGKGRRFRLQRALIGAISPTPRRAFFLDVSPEVAFARKGEWGVEWLAGHRDLYLEEAHSMGVRVLDGEQPRETICEQIASDVWRAL